MYWLFRPVNNRTGVHWQTFAVGLIVFVLVTHLTTDETGLAAAGVVGVFLLLIQEKAESRLESLQKPRFWVLIAVLAMVHLFALFYFRVPEFSFGLAIAPFGFVDYFAMRWLIEWIERHFPARSPQ